MYKYTTYTLIATASTLLVVLAALKINNSANMMVFDVIDKTIIVLVAIVISITLIKIIK